MKVVFPSPVWAKMLYWTRKTDLECGGFGYVSIDGPDAIIHDVIMVPQVATGSSVEFDAAGIAKAQYTHRVENKPGELKFQWHSHNTMGAFWSGTDKNNMETLSQHGWQIFSVINHKGEIQSAMWQPSPEIRIDIDTEILEIPRPLSAVEYDGFMVSVQQAYEAKDWHQVQAEVEWIQEQLTRGPTDKEAGQMWDAEFEANWKGKHKVQITKGKKRSRIQHDFFPSYMDIDEEDLEEWVAAINREQEGYNK